MQNSNLIKEIAYNAIKSSLNGKELLLNEDVLKNNPDFKTPKATFVTLKKNGKLRGCIGSLVAYQPFYKDLISNAKKAAFNDPRFKPLSKDELKDINLEVSILTEPILVKYNNIEDLKNKIKIGKDGIILKYGSYQATFLPQVWDDLNNFELFFSHLCLKAGLEVNCLSKHPVIYKYQVQKIEWLIIFFKILKVFKIELISLYSLTEWG